MVRRQRVSAIQPVRGHQAKVRKPSGKELDLLLLAGCSCLLTLLHHPVAEALQSHHLGNATSSVIATRTSQTTSNPMNAFHLTLLSSQDERIEEEEA